MLAVKLSELKYTMTAKALTVHDLRARRIHMFCEQTRMYIDRRCQETGTSLLGLKTYMKLIERDMLTMDEEFELTTLIRLLSSEPQCEAQFRQYEMLKKAF